MTEQYGDSGMTLEEAAIVMHDMASQLRYQSNLEVVEARLMDMGYKLVPTDSSDMDSLVRAVEQWSSDKGLDEAESSKQMLKVVEEVGEVAAALARGQVDELRDGIGDVIVTLIILAQQNDMELYECLDQAYSEIADRKGQTVNGVFVKDE